MSQTTRQYETSYSLWLATVAQGERPEATVEEMDLARHALARRADRVRREQPALQGRYDAILARLLTAGWR